MVPCIRLYAALARRIASEQKQCKVDPSLGPSSAGVYQEWVDTYAADDFEALASKLEGMLDRLAARPLAPSRALLREHYVRAMELELGFFGAWAPTETAPSEVNDRDRARPPA